MRAKLFFLNSMMSKFKLYGIFLPKDYKFSVMCKIYLYKKMNIV